jgi:hypothetical protein
MTIKLIELNDTTDATHEADLFGLLPGLRDVYCHFLGAFNGAPDDVDAIARWVEQAPPEGRPLMQALGSATAAVIRSMLSARSRREQAIRFLSVVRDALAAAAEDLSAYLAVREDETTQDRFLAFATSGAPRNYKAHDARVANVVAEWRADAQKLDRSTEALATLLCLERTRGVAAGLYSTKGAGPAAEWAVQLAKWGLQPRLIAHLRGDMAKKAQTRTRTPTRKRKRKRRGETSDSAKKTARVRSEINRARRAMRLRSLAK